MKDEVSDKELKKVIADFLEMGHVDNIFEMFKQDTRYYDWAGVLLDDDSPQVQEVARDVLEELS